MSYTNAVPISDNEITHRINVDEFIDDKIAAIQCHKTQSSVWQQIVEMNINFKEFARCEVFVQKYPKPDNNSVKHNLFE